MRVMVTSDREAANILRIFYETVDKKPYNRSAVEKFFCEDFKDNNRPPAPAGVPDREVILGLFDQLNAGLPDAKHELIILEPIGSNRAMVYWKFEGTNSGPFYGTPASGNKVSINGVDIFRVEKGCFVEHWHVEELAAMTAQMQKK